MGDAYLQQYNKELEELQKTPWNPESLIINPYDEGAEHLRDTDDAIRKEMSEQGYDDPLDQTAAGAFLSNAVDAVLFGWSDELVARVGSVFDEVDYEGFLQQLETTRAQANLKNPNAALAGNIIGSLAGFGAVKMGVSALRTIGAKAAALMGQNLIGGKAVQMATSAVTSAGKTRALNLLKGTGTTPLAQVTKQAILPGAVAGGLTGAGTDSEDRVSGAIKGAGFGAAAGAVLGGAIKGGEAVIKALRGAPEDALAKMATTAGATVDDLASGLTATQAGDSALDTGITGIKNIADDLTESTVVTDLTNPVATTRMASQRSEVLDEVQNALKTKVADPDTLKEGLQAKVGPLYKAIEDVPVSRETDAILTAADPARKSGNAIAETIDVIGIQGENVSPQLAKDLKLKPFKFDADGVAVRIDANGNPVISSNLDDEVLNGLQSAKDPSKFLYESVARREINTNGAAGKAAAGIQADGTVDPSKMSIDFSKKLVNTFTQAKEGIKKFTLNVKDQGKAIQKDLKKAEKRFTRLTTDKNAAKRAEKTVKGKAAVETKFRRRLEDAENRVTELQTERNDLAKVLNKSRKNIRTLNSTAIKAIKTKQDRQSISTIGNVRSIAQQGGAALKANQKSGKARNSADQGAAIKEDITEIMSKASPAEKAAYDEGLRIDTIYKEGMERNEAIAKAYKAIQTVPVTKTTEGNVLNALKDHDLATLEKYFGKAKVQAMTETLAGKLGDKFKATKMFAKQGKGSSLNIRENSKLDDVFIVGPVLRYVKDLAKLGEVSPEVQRNLATAIFGLDKARAEEILTKTISTMKNQSKAAELRQTLSGVFAKIVAGEATED